MTASGRGAGTGRSVQGGWPRRDRQLKKRRDTNKRINLGVSHPLRRAAGAIQEYGKEGMPDTVVYIRSQPRYGDQVVAFPTLYQLKQWWPSQRLRVVARDDVGRYYVPALGGRIRARVQLPRTRALPARARQCVDQSASQQRALRAGQPAAPSGVAHGIPQQSPERPRLDAFASQEHRRIHRPGQSAAAGHLPFFRSPPGGAELLPGNRRAAQAPGGAGRRGDDSRRRLRPVQALEHRALHPAGGPAQDLDRARHAVFLCWGRTRPPSSN